tara:strand:- start:2259 stop:2705 length:447 start_codon:yes stop_codon:yes gene_type:complete
MKVIHWIIAASSMLGFQTAIAEPVTLKPAVMSRQDIAGEIFKRPSLIIEKRDNGTEALDVVSLLSSDKKFVTGMYQAQAGHFEITDAWGVDEYMHFLKGSVKLTSSDGTVIEVNEGQSVTIAKEWTGVWDTQGYTKIYVIYSPDKPLE